MMAAVRSFARGVGAAELLDQIIAPAIVLCRRQPWLWTVTLQFVITMKYAMAYFAAITVVLK